ncbi:long-chain fatty acid--CoA ligase [Actinomadura nitritigenes]|uniref:Long-chain fatty acid--CoA ligase n=1 Tax=Actinomadura nitritigenes TaxID=134602 RepID=A0ABS3RFG0_9ACTN|nr:long-chain fatty acid--CoA ligase [Actinomadura nitritigenes]MBO2444958.1 long-chain fatty acid--CoA ligase [Actinomadura nitritigenes]
MYSLASVLDQHAERRPGKTVIVDGDRRLTNRDLLSRVEALAHGLLDLGLGRGDVIGLLLYNHAEFLEALLAAGRIGAVFLPLNYRLAPAEWEYILGHAGARAIITESEFAPVVEGLALPELRHRITLDEGTGTSWTRLPELVEANLGRRVPLADLAEDDLQRLMYTSGTTSRPKGVKITNGNVNYKNLGQIVQLGLTHADITLVCGPMYHVGALDLPALATWHAGGSLIVQRRFDAGEVLRAIERERTTNVWLAPAMMNAVLESPELDRRDTSSVRFIVGGGEKMPEALVRRIHQAFPNAWFADAYGLTETVSGDTFLDREHALTKLGSVGRPIPHVRVRVVGEDGRDAPAGTLGEIVLRGPKVFAGYWRDDAATDRAFRDGWFHTGDIGRLDEDGFLYVEDRKKDMIVSGGENIATPEVERVLYEHPAVLEAAVVGLPHERWGEVPRAFVVPRPGETVTEEDVQEFCRARLARFKVPARVEVIDELPRTPSGKVLKRLLRERPGAGAR